MRKNVDFIIRYEHKVRELESIMLIKIELERRGYSVEFVGNYEHDRTDYPKPRFLIAPAVYRNSHLKWDLFHYGLLKKIVNLQWEQLVGTEEEEDINGDHNIKELGTRILNFCWGQRTHDRIVKGGVPSENAPIVGQINTDLLRWRFKDMLMSKQQLAEKYMLDFNKRWYLFVSTFAYCEMDPIQEALALKAWGKEHLDHFKDTSYKTREVILDWFEGQLTTHKNILVIYRPHPDETNKCKRLKDMVQKYPNFKMISEEALKQWVNACDKIYNWYSTGMVDAIVLHKPVRLLRPYTIKKELDYRIFIGAESIKSKKDFDMDFPDISEKEVIDKSLFDSYYFLPERPVYLLICDKLEEMMYSNKHDVNYSLMERLTHAKDIVIWNCFWGIEKYIFSKLPARLQPSFYRKALQIRKIRQDSLKEGRDKNVATEDEIKELYERLKPIVYAQ